MTKTRVWKEYQVERSRPRSARLMASLSRKGILMLNGEAFRALGSPRAVKVMFDDTDGGAIGLAAAAPTERNAIQFHTHLPRNGRYLTLTHFCSVNGIAASHTIVFEEPEMDGDGRLVLEFRG